MSSLSTSIGPLKLGEIPRVVGTITSEAALVSFKSVSNNPPCDIVEVRVDEIGVENTDCISECGVIESLGFPVIFTLRLACEGGKWKVADRERLPIFEKAVVRVSGIDVEYKSEIVTEVVQMAKERGKFAIVSYHDFAATPSFDDLARTIEEASAHGAAVKVSTMVNEESDVGTLLKVLARHWACPVSIIGMGAKGTKTRVTFPCHGSSLTYGFLDFPAAPGQLSAPALVQQLRTLLPAYNEDVITRYQLLKCV